MVAIQVVVKCAERLRCSGLTDLLVERLMGRSSVRCGHRDPADGVDVGGGHRTAQSTTHDGGVPAVHWGNPPSGRRRILTVHR